MPTLFHYFSASHVYDDMALAWLSQLGDDQFPTQSQLSPTALKRQRRPQKLIGSTAHKLAGKVPVTLQ